MYPHERSLVKELANEPFALIGVNSDRDREQLKQTVKDKSLTWRSFWDGGSTSGPIATAWNIQGWPTTYLIDHEGVIRAKNAHGDSEKFDAMIHDLVAKAKAGNKSGSSAHTATGGE